MLDYHGKVMVVIHVYDPTYFRKRFQNEKFSNLMVDFNHLAKFDILLLSRNKVDTFLYL